MKDVKVDIVIPIYNAYDFTKKCIERYRCDMKKESSLFISI